MDEWRIDWDGEQYRCRIPLLVPVTVTVPAKTGTGAKRHHILAAARRVTTTTAHVCPWRGDTVTEFERHEPTHGTGGSAYRGPAVTLRGVGI